MGLPDCNEIDFYEKTVTWKDIENRRDVEMFGIVLLPEWVVIRVNIYSSFIPKYP